MARKFERVTGHDEAMLPVRSTMNAAGYDFFANREIVIPSSLFLHTDNDGKLTITTGDPTVVFTNVKACMESDEALFLYNRSSNPKKRHLVLANGVGVVDSDYYNNPDNEGNIGFAFYNMSFAPVTIKAGDKIGQGVFQKYLKVDDDEGIDSTRQGGFGSTGK